ncbi:MAG: putative ABC exporter domain-containing protein [Gemmatimonadaceae bacterium]
MSGAAAALRYLWFHTTVNRLRAQIKRLRSVRNSIAVLLTFGYFYFIFWHNTGGKNGTSGPFGSLIGNEFVAPVAAAFLLFTSARWWLFGKDRSALAFTPAEVQFLFPAPISRRGLIHAKLVRGQLAILINTLIWSVFLRGNGATAGGWQRGVAVWLLFSTLSLHRLGATIVRTNALEHQKAGQRRSILPIVVFVAVFAGVAWGLVSQISAIEVASTQGIKAAMHSVVVALGQRVPSIALWPIRSIVEPVFATSAATWLRLLPASLLVFALHYIWVLRLDASFEEAALEATQVRAERIQSLRSSQGLRKRDTKGKISRIPKLALLGRPEVAIMWKNVAAALRGSAWRAQTIIFFIGLAAVAAMTRFWGDTSADVFIAMCGVWGGMLVFIGPFSMRYDLRLDLPRLAILKTYPLPGSKLVAAEIAGVTILHSISIWTIMIVPVTMFVIRPSMFGNVNQISVILLAIAVAIPALNLLMFTVQNGAALLFPSWVRLGTETRGFETMGQNLLTMGATSLVAAVALVFPIALGLLVVWLGTSYLGPWALFVGALLASALVCAEMWPVIVWLGQVFERTDVNDVATSQ